MPSEETSNSVALSETNKRSFELLYKHLFDDLSVRARNILIYNGVNGLDDLLPWLEGKSDNFLMFRNCGKRTSKEIMEMVSKLRTFLESVNQSDNNNELEIEKLIHPNSFRPNNTITTNVEDEIKFKLFFDNLSIRAQHVLLNNKINSLRGLAPWIEGKSDNFLMFRNCGKRTSIELMEMVCKLKDSIVLLYQQGEENDFESQEKETNRIVEKYKGFYSQFPNPTAIDRLLDMEKLLGYFPFFLALNLTLLSNENRENYILTQCSAFFVDNSSKTLSEIGSEKNLSRERVRQIRSKKFRVLRDKIIKLSKTGCLEKYKYNPLNDYELKNIASREEVPFNSNLIVWVICQIDDQYKLLGDVSNAFFKSSTSTETLYAVPKELCKHFDFIKFIESIEIMLHGKRFFEERIELEQYISGQCKKNIDIEVFYSIVKICRNIMERGYPDNIVNSQIVFPANARKTIPFLIEDILREFDSPMNAVEISKEINERYPDLETTPAKIRTNALRNSNIVAVSRMSTYALSEWNDTEKRGGTIRELATEYLNSLIQPIAPSSEICDYIAKFREGIKESNIKANLLAESNNRFGLYFKEGVQYIGLTDGYFGDEFVLQDKRQGRRTFSDSIGRLEQFIKDNGHFPFTSGVDDEEARLSRFYNVSLGYLRKGALSAEETSEIERITTTYGHLKVKKERISWDKWLERLVGYINENNALPNHSSREYVWYEENKTLFETDQLDPNKTSAFAFLVKIIDRLPQT